MTAVTTTERLPDLDERETLFTIDATDRKTVTVFSNDSVWQGRIEKLGIEPFRINGYGKWYKVGLGEFSFGIRKKRQVSDEQRAVLAERFAALRGAVTDSDDEDESEDV